MKHNKECLWGSSNCEYKNTHNYCPHEEHKSLECKCFEQPECGVEVATPCRLPRGHAGMHSPNEK